jgi:hypothetical protein
LSKLLHTSVSTGGSGPPPTVGTGTVPAAVQQALDAAQADYTQALAALAAGSLGEYQTDVIAMEGEINTAQAALAAESPTTTTTTAPTTTTTTPKKKTKSTTTTPTPARSTTTTTLATAAGQQ